MSRPAHVYPHHVALSLRVGDREVRISRGPQNGPDRNSFGLDAVAAIRHGSLAVLGLTMVLLPHSTRLFGRDGLFGLLAAMSAVLAILFLAAA